MKKILLGAMCLSSLFLVSCEDDEDEREFNDNRENSKMILPLPEDTDEE